MMQIFRSFMHSRIGVYVALGFIVLIFIAFAAADVTGSRQFGSVTGGDRVAMVGSRKISTADLSSGATNAVERLKQQQPALTMKAFVAGGGLNDVLDQLVDRAAIAEFGKAHGVVVSDRLIDSELAKIDAFKGPDGKFSATAFHALLNQRGLSEAAVRQDLADGLIARELLVPGSFGARMPRDLAARYAALLSEQRLGSIALLPSAAFAPKGEPSAADLAAFYQSHRANYIRPERRTIRYALFDDSALPPVPPPSDAEIAARYNANKDIYAPTELRKVTQLVVLGEAAAKAVAAEVQGGKSLEEAAKARGLDTVSVGPMARPALTAQASPAIADAAFAAARGKVVGPVRGPLGWTLLRVDQVDNRAGKTLDQAKGEIAAELTALKKRAALSDFTAKVEDGFDKGGSLGDVAKELKVTPKLVGPVTADGKLYGAQGSVPTELARVVPAAFSMEREGQPQVAEVVAGKQFVVFDVSAIVPSAAAPIAEIRPQVMADLMLSRGSTAAKDAASRLQAEIRKGTDPAAALTRLGVANLPPVQRIAIDRQQMAQMGNRIPPPIGLLFAMAQGTTKVLAGPGGRGWFVVTLNKIVTGDQAKIAPLIDPAMRELSQSSGQEYATQLRRAMREELKPATNPVAIKAVASRLAGE